MPETTEVPVEEHETPVVPEAAATDTATAEAAATQEVADSAAPDQEQQMPEAAATDAATADVQDSTPAGRAEDAVPEEKEATLEELNKTILPADELRDKWIGAEEAPENGVLFSAIKDKLITPEVRLMIQNEVEGQFLKDYLAELHTELHKNPEVGDVKTYLQGKATEINQAIQDKIKQEVLKNMAGLENADQLVQLLFPAADNEETESEEAKKYKENSTSFLRSLGGAFSDWTVDSMKSSDLGTFLDALFVADAGRLHRAAFSSFKEKNSLSESNYGIPEMKEHVKKLKGEDSTFKGYDRYFNALGRAHSKVTKQVNVDSDFIKDNELEDGKQVELQDKAGKLYQLFDTLIRAGNAGQVNEVFQQAMIDDLGMDKDTAKTIIIKEDILDVLKLLKNDTEYKKYITD